MFLLAIKDHVTLCVLERILDGTGPTLRNVDYMPGTMLGGMKGLPISTAKLVDHTHATSMLCKLDTLSSSVDARDWLFKGLIAVRGTIVGELEGIDSMLRDNNADYLRHQSTSIKLFTDKLLKTTEDGYAFASPVYYWRCKVDDDRKAGAVHYDLKQRLRVDGRLAYKYLWLFDLCRQNLKVVCRV
jgi:hypothetical protein